MLGNGCFEAAIPVNFQMEGRAAGADKRIIGRHTVKIDGTITKHCDCSWSFDGSMSSALGYDIYGFPPSNRDKQAEFETWIGSQACPKRGKPFNIYLPGRIKMRDGGKIDGVPTCCGF